MRKTKSRAIGACGSNDSHAATRTMHSTLLLVPGTRARLPHAQNHLGGSQGLPTSLHRTVALPEKTGRLQRCRGTRLTTLSRSLRLDLEVPPRSSAAAFSPAIRSALRPDVTTSENAPTSVLGKLGTVTVLMRSVSKGVTAVAAKQAEMALHVGGNGGGGGEEGGVGGAPYEYNSRRAKGIRGWEAQGWGRQVTKRARAGVRRWCGIPMMCSCVDIVPTRFARTRGGGAFCGRVPIP